MRVMGNFLVQFCMIQEPKMTDTHSHKRSKAVASSLLSHAKED